MGGQNGAYSFRYVSIWIPRFDAVFGQSLPLKVFIRGLCLAENANAFSGFSDLK